MNEFDILEGYGSPLYLYNYSVLEKQCLVMYDFCESLSEKLGVDVSAHYSSKANNNFAILSIVKSFGLNVDCMSPYELKINTKVGFSNDRMLYVCNNISADEMRLVHESGVLICLDSISQVETWGKLFPGTDIMVRINPGTTGVGHSKGVITSGRETKFGISQENLPSLLKVAKKYRLTIVGTHQHLGSLFLTDKIPDYLDGVQAGLAIVKKYFPKVEIVDLGGGFGVPYAPNEKPLDLKLLQKVLTPILKPFLTAVPSVREIKFEPGRFIPCEAGNLLGTVTSIKFENGTYWVGTDIGMNQLVRPSMYGSYHEIEVIYRGEKGPLEKVNFCGNICESGDILGKDRCVHLPQVGDAVIVKNAGAYGYSMASNYTGRPRPAEVLLQYPFYELIRPREELTV